MLSVVESPMELTGKTAEAHSTVAQSVRVPLTACSYHNSLARGVNLFRQNFFFAGPWSRYCHQGRVPRACPGYPLQTARKKARGPIGPLPC